MNYFIVFIAQDDYEWVCFVTDNRSYADRVFNDLILPPDYVEKELRCTRQPIDSYWDFKVIRSE